MFGNHLFEQFEKALNEKTAIDTVEEEKMITNEGTNNDNADVANSHKTDDFDGTEKEDLRKAYEDYFTYSEVNQSSNLQEVVSKVVNIN